MIRFCDREIGCVEYDSLNRRELLSYFLSGHIDDIIVVYDSFDTMRYLGNITYHSLLFAINIDSAIQEEYLILNQDIWKNGRKYFDRNDKRDGEIHIIPVVSEEQQIVCFAYEDNDANREIRMLSELTEHPEALQFTDVYLEYQCVRIDGFNELAYFFAEYLERQNVAVEVNGTMWEGIFNGNECQSPDYKCMTIHAEGISGKKHNLKENLLRSASVEFECIDKIYEENIKRGLIKDAKGNCADLLERLRDEKEIIILRTRREEQNAYGFLLGKGIDICCFVNMQADEPCHRMFGKKMLREAEARRIYKNPVFIDCAEKASAWGFGKVDYYDYIGY